jgi:RNA polymerase sigma factor (sigma-70 family)
VLVTDISMPYLNGIEAARAIRERDGRVAIVVLSMHSSSEHVARAFAAGANGYVLKDAASEEIVAAVRAVANGRRYLSRELAEVAHDATAQGASPLDSLSARERQVLQLVVEGKSSAQIAQQIHLSPKTVETYRSRLMKKLAVADIPALVKFAVQHGVTALD